MNAALELAQYRPLINKVFPFDQLKDAYEYMLSGDHLGKIVVNLIEDDQIEWREEVTRRG
jgi:NADPH:quinone reductase-like Zn-dependent oxidoreductase